MKGMGRKLKVNLLYGYTAESMHVLPTFCICMFSMWFLTYTYNQNSEFVIWVYVDEKILQALWLESALTKVSLKPPNKDFLTQFL